MVMKREKDIWTEPQTASFSGTFSDVDLFIAPDGKRLFFCSNRPLDGKGGMRPTFDIWVVERRGPEWSEPVNLGPPVNSDENEFYPTVTKDGTLYFQSWRPGSAGGRDLYRSRLESGAYRTVERLGGPVNGDLPEGDGLISPDETFLVYSVGRPDGFGQGDLYVSFRSPDGSWTEPRNLGEAVNTKLNENCPILSPDGKFLFYTSGGDIYWVSSEIIKNPPAPAEALPLHTERLSDKVLLAWVGDLMQTIRVVALSTARGVVVIDSNLSRSADARIRKAIEAEFGRKDVKYLINTHFHHDHTLGNQVYADATIVAQRTAVEGMKNEQTGEGLTKLLEMFRGMERDWGEKLKASAPGSKDQVYFREGVALLGATIGELQEGFRPTYPALLVDDRHVLDMGDLTVELYAVGGTHTPSDLMIFVPEEGLVAIGDTWPDRMLPYLPKKGSWDLGRILENWGRVAGGDREIKRVNMAHSDMALGVETYRQQYRYLKTLWDGLREMRSRGATLDEAKKRFTIERDFPYFKDRITAMRGTNIHGNNVEAIWDRIEK